NGVCKGEEPRAWTDFISVCACCKAFTRLQLLGNRFPQLLNVGTGEVQLTDFFFQSHARDQVVDTAIHRLCRVEVDRRWRLCMQARGYGERDDNEQPPSHPLGCCVTKLSDADHTDAPLASNHIALSYKRASYGGRPIRRS